MPRCPLSLIQLVESTWHSACVYSRCPIDTLIILVRLFILTIVIVIDLGCAEKEQKVVRNFHGGCLIHPSSLQTKPGNHRGWYGGRWVYFHLNSCQRRQQLAGETFTSASDLLVIVRGFLNVLPWKSEKRRSHYRHYQCLLGESLLFFVGSVFLHNWEITHLLASDLSSLLSFLPVLLLLPFSSLHICGVPTVC